MDEKQLSKYNKAWEQFEKEMRELKRKQLEVLRQISLEIDDKKVKSIMAKLKS